MGKRRRVIVTKTQANKIVCAWVATVLHHTDTVLAGRNFSETEEDRLSEAIDSLADALQRRSGVVSLDGSDGFVEEILHRPSKIEERHCDRV
jgi:hypothetical protein